MRLLRLPVLIMVLAVMAGCAAHQRRSSLSTTLDAYAASLRWGNFSQSLDFVDPAYRAAHPLTPLQLARYKQVRLVDYDASDGPVPVNDSEVRQTVKIGVINRNTQRERFFIDHQVWKWDPKAGRWWLETGLPDITQSAQ